MIASHFGNLFVVVVALIVCCLNRLGSAAELDKAPSQTSLAATSKPLADALPPGRWQQLEDSVDHALAWSASQQLPDGSFPTIPAGQPAVTSLCVLAFLSRGHQPGLGPYGQRLNAAIDFVISCQTSNGLFCYQAPAAQHMDKTSSHTAVYNHAIAGLMLGEVYGHVNGERAKAAKRAIERALAFTRQLQVRPKAFPADNGGWRYLQLRFDPSAADSDLSVTAWQLMFLRSARNAEFDVPQSHIDDAMAFVRRCWNEQSGMFNYALEGGGDVRSSRGITAAGILSLSMGGQHQTAIACQAGDWLLAHPYQNFGQLIGVCDRFYYSTYYCSQAMAQLGGHYWEKFFPSLAEALLSAQSPDGSWPPEPGHGDAIFGNAYSTAMAVLSLTTPYQLLPLYQR